MTTGIYLLKFGDEYDYVGQALSIENRLSQHIDRLSKGKAAEKMQWAYNTFGPPEAFILTKCHRDHLDALEAYYISFYDSEYSLNTTKPSSTISSINIDSVLLFSESSLESICVDLESAQVELQEYKDEIVRLKRLRSIEELTADINSRLPEVNRQLANTILALSSLTENIEKYNSMPWYRRIFTKAPL